jgi:hypothetical protein
MCYRGRGLPSAQLPTATRGKSIVTCIIMIRPVAEDRRYNGSVHMCRARLCGGTRSNTCNVR